MLFLLDLKQKVDRGACTLKAHIDRRSDGLKITCSHSHGGKCGLPVILHEDGGKSDDVLRLVRSPIRNILAES